MEDLLAQNAFMDAQDLAEDIGREFMPGDLTQYKEHGLDLQVAAAVFVKTYTGENMYTRSLRTKSYPLTQAQACTALNVMREERLGLKPSAPTASPKALADLQCFTCKGWYKGWDALNAHKSQEHGKGKAVTPAFTDKGDAKDVLENTASTMGLDLSNLPDGRYAVPDKTGKNDNIFLMVKRVRKTVHRDRRYVYGKIVTGNEIVVAGTIEVRIWSSDTKEWVGQQKPGDVYRGKFEEELTLIMLMPEPFAILFGRLLHYCGRCGKALTDKTSRDIGLGLECEKQRFYFTSPPKYTYIGASRPNPKAANPYDEAYLKGEMSRWVDPPKVVDVPDDDEEVESD